MVIKNEFFVFQLNAHVVFGGSNVFELQLNLHGVSFPKYFMRINYFTIVLLSVFLVKLNLSILPALVLRSLHSVLILVFTLKQRKIVSVLDFWVGANRLEANRPGGRCALLKITRS